MSSPRGGVSACVCRINLLVWLPPRPWNRSLLRAGKVCVANRTLVHRRNGSLSPHALRVYARLRFFGF